jgi:hypothetical protein
MSIPTCLGRAILPVVGAVALTMKCLRFEAILEERAKSPIKKNKGMTERMAAEP